MQDKADLLFHEKRISFFENQWTVKSCDDLIKRFLVFLVVFVLQEVFLSSSFYLTFDQVFIMAVEDDVTCPKLFCGHSSVQISFCLHDIFPNRTFPIKELKPNKPYHC